MLLDISPRHPTNCTCASERTEHTMQTIKISYRGETIRLTCDLTDASAPLTVDGCETPYQTADARHRAALAVALACRHAWPEVEWPEVPATGPVDTSAWDACEAWAEMEYETIEEPPRPRAADEATR